jgi:hypothetical protein
MQTNLQKLLFYTTIVLAAFFFLIALPNFKIDLQNGSLIEWRGLSSLGVSENLFNFARGRGVYAKTQIEFKAKPGALETEAFSQAFARDRKAVMNRLAYVNSIVGADLYVREYLPAPADKTIVFEFPQYITAPEQLAKDLLGKGKISITRPALAAADGTLPKAQEGSIVDLYFPGYVPVETGLTITDITNFNVDSSTLVTVPVLKTKFKPEARVLLYETFAQTQYGSNGAPTLPLLIMVDDIPEFWAFHPDLFTGKTVDNFPTDLIWVPVNATDKLNLAIRAASLIGDKVELDYDQSPVTIINPEYAPDGRLFIVGAFMLLIAVFVVRAFLKFKWQGAIFFAISFGTSVLTLVGFAKLINSAIDPVMITVFAVAIVLLGQWNLQIMENGMDKLASGLRSQLHISILLFLLASILFQFPAAKLIRGYELILILSLALGLASQVYNRGVISMYYQTKDAK